MNKLLKISVFIVIFAWFTFSVFAQRNGNNANTILTAADFFQSVSENYGKITDYEADVVITASKTSMDGHVSFKRPSMLRIDFSKPQNQVILYNGSELIIYLPGTQAILRQNISKDSGAGSAVNIAIPQGLALLGRYYLIAYESGPNTEPLEPDNPKSEKVIKLSLDRKNSSESFRRINIAVNPKTKLIRQISATTTNDEQFSILFSEYRVNQTIPDTRFLYDTPPTANEYNNFLFAE
ncbi:MAG: LolA family protein [Treponemataceae bacterium]